MFLKTPKPIRRSMRFKIEGKDFIIQKEILYFSDDEDTDYEVIDIDYEVIDIDYGSSSLKQLLSIEEDEITETTDEYSFSYSYDESNENIYYTEEISSKSYVQPEDMKILRKVDENEVITGKKYVFGFFEPETYVEDKDKNEDNENIKYYRAKV